MRFINQSQVRVTAGLQRTGPLSHSRLRGGTDVFQVVLSYSIEHTRIDKQYNMNYSLVFYAEKDSPVLQWTFLDSFWWGLMTLTTGDIILGPPCMYGWCFGIMSQCPRARYCRKDYLIVEFYLTRGATVFCWRCSGITYPIKSTVMLLTLLLICCAMMT